VKVTFTLLAALAALPVLGGYLGALHPMGDSLAVFRLQGAGLLAVLSALALALGAAHWGRIGMLLGLLAGVPVVWSYGAMPALGPEPSGDLRVYQKNMLFRNDDLVGLAADIRAGAPEAVLLQEVSQANLALMEDLATEFPHQLRCDFASVGGTAVLTRLEPVPGSEVCAEGLAALQVQGPTGPVWLVSVHLHWPWPFGQAAQVGDLVPVLEGLEGSVVMAGDFNMVRWSWTYGALAGAARVQAAGKVAGTLPMFRSLLTLPIDHVLAPGGGRVELRGALGSDHLGLLADVTL
jgi:endonuclease/exonuclease/phosphatase (EEP) superfamily protein YafD